MIPHASHGNAASDETAAIRLARVKQSGHQTSGSWRVHEEGVSALEAYDGGKNWFREAQGLQPKLVTLEVKPLPVSFHSLFAFVKCST
jgi:hypothetical protein